MSNDQVFRECERVLGRRGILPFNNQDRQAQRKRLQTEPSHLDSVFENGSVFREGFRQLAEKKPRRFLQAVRVYLCLKVSL